MIPSRKLEAATAGFRCGRLLSAHVAQGDWPILRSGMGKLEATARRLLLGSRVYPPLRLGYQFLFDHARFAHRHSMRSFYSSFVRKGDLVFDVGAHVGRHAELFTDLGARVVSIEPNPSCCEQLNRLSKIRDIHVENCAAGDRPGKIKLRICQDSVISTVVEAWYEGARRSPLHQDAKWLESVEVDVVTLDRLAQRYGIPTFVKIDAEGYDDHVLSGMSFRPRALSFEYNRLLPQTAERCFETHALSRGYEFNFSRGLDLKYVSENWVSGQELCKQLSDFAAEEEYGDVYARSTMPSD
jgi:FkbM family methyltransferase